ncbi:hypothetical protein BDZ89DRAFT_1075063 [Hymenopellis radicata]|nr:hypothetical protein BDZ89DRAFT_1075063 [Hymenopellis radicata]
MYTPFENRTTAAHAPAAPGRKCRGLSVDELKRLPAWTAMEQHIRNTLGVGSYNLNLWTAWDGAPHAWMCVGDDVVDLQATGSPGCTINTFSNVGGTLVGSSGSVTIGITTGFISSSDYTVTKSATIGISDTATLTVGVPDLISGNGSWPASAQFTNQDQYSFKTELNNQTLQSVTLNAPSGSTCSLNYETKTCHETVKGRVPYTGSGYVHVAFDEPTQGHHDWYVPITNEPFNTRTSYSEFTGSVWVHSRSRYSGHCT